MLGKVNGIVCYALFVLAFVTLAPSITMASGFVIPASIVHYANISISNSQSSATVNGLQVMISFNALAYQQYEANSLNNTEFFYTNNGTVVPSWMEGNRLNWYQPANTLYTSQNVIFWIKYGPSIAAHSTATNTIAIGFGTKTTNLLNNVDTGEAPQLSCANPSNTILCNYGEYDDGSSVFNHYWNFSHASTWSAGGAGYGPKGIEYADNGMRVQGWIFDNVAGITAPGNIITVLVNATAYSSTNNAWAEALSLSNTSSGNGLGSFPGIGTISGTYTYSPYVYLYNYADVPHMQTGLNIADLKAPHTISIGFNNSGEINYTAINYGSSMGSETSNMLLSFQSGYYDGPLRVQDIACNNLTLTSAKAELAASSIKCTGTIDNEGQILGLTPTTSCNGNSAAGYNGGTCGAIPSSFAGSGGAGGGNVLLSLVGGNGGNTLIAGGLGSTGTGQNGATPAAPSVVDAANVVKWGSAPLTYLQSGGGGGGANGGSGGDGRSDGTFIEANKVIAGNVIETPFYSSGSGAGGAGGGALLIAYGSGGYTAGNYNLLGASGGSAGSAWSAGGNGGAGQLITYDYGSNAMPISVSFPKQTETYPILSSMEGNASFYYMYSRRMPPLSAMPSVSFSSTYLTPSCTVFITNPSNAIVDVGQYESFVVTEDNCTGPYTYNILISNSITPSVITHNNLLTGQTASSVTYAFPTTNADVSNSPEVANVILTSGSHTVFSSYSSSFSVNPTLSAASISSSPAFPVTEDTGNVIKFTAGITGGSSPYTYNFLISNITTSQVVGNYLVSNSDTSNTVSWQIPYQVGNNALEVNVIVSDRSSGGAETINSIYIKPLYTKSTISITNVFPNSCIAQGGCIVEVNGTGFFSGTTVNFGSTAATAVNIINYSSMQVTVPPGTAENNVTVSVHSSFGANSVWNGTFDYGYTFLADNFTNNLNFTRWNETPNCCFTGGYLYTVAGGQTTFDNTITPNPIFGTHEAMIWYPFRHGIVDINGTKMTLVSGDPFDPNWGNSGIYLGGYYGMVTNNASTLYWLSGSKFIANGSWVNQNITIYEQGRKIVSVANSIQMVLNKSAGGNTGYFITDKWWIGLSHRVASCTSSTDCTLSQNLGIQNNVKYISGTDDINNFFGQSFQSNRPTTMFVRGYVYFQAPTHGGPYGQRKVYYIKDACGGSTGLPCVGEAYIISSYDFTPFRGNVSIDGTSVNWVSGHQFPTDGSWNGKGILINGSKNYTIASVTNATHLTLTSSAGNYISINYTSLVDGIQLADGAQSEIVNGSFTDSEIYMDPPYLNFNQWYEIQVEAVLNTPGIANGYFKVWINGQYRPDLSRSGVEWRNTSNDQGWQYVEVGRQLDAGNAGNSRIAWENEYRFWDAVALANAYLPSPVQLQPLNIAFTTATTTSTSTTTVTSSSTTTAVSTAPTTAGASAPSGGGGAGGGGGGGSSLPTVSPYNTSSVHGWQIQNITQDNSENLKINGKLFGITLNSISPKSADVTVNGESYSLDMGTPVSIGNGYSLNLSYVSYLPIIDTVTLQIYYNSNQTSVSNTIQPQNYNVTVDLNSSSFFAGTSRYITAYAVNSSYTVAIYANGVLQAEGDGLASFNINTLKKGNYTLQACIISVSPRVCGATQKLAILAPTSTVLTTVPVTTNTGQTSETSSGTSAIEYIALIVATATAVGAIIFLMLRYHGKIGRSGNGGEIGKTDAEAASVDSPVSEDVDKNIERHEEHHEESHEPQPVDSVTHPPDTGQQGQDKEDSTNQEPPRT
jgi:hypothetical protein